MPSVEIPEGKNSVRVSIIDNGARIKGPIAMFIEPPLLDHLSEGAAPAFVFLIEHEATGHKLLFDLSIRKDINKYAPSVLEYHRDFSFLPGEDIFDILRNSSVDLESVEAIIWSHHHIDHIGNPAGFPPTTDLVVGPGFKETELPGYPENPKAKILEADYDGRRIRQIDFDNESKGLKIGDFRAFDWFGDGSFYLLETPGHTVDHLAALARTSTDPSRFIFMGGDIGHHPSQWRPNQYTSLPAELIPSPFGPESTFNIRRDVCPCAVYIENIPGEPSPESPFTRIRAGHPYDVDMSRAALGSMEIFDADDDIMVIIAHDWTLLSVLDYWPKPANGWYEAGWKSRGRWEFLRDLIKETSE